MGDETRERKIFTWYSEYLGEGWQRKGDEGIRDKIEINIFTQLGDDVALTGDGVYFVWDDDHGGEVRLESWADERARNTLDRMQDVITLFDAAGPHASSATIIAILKQCGFENLNELGADDPVRDI